MAGGRNNAIVQCQSKENRFLKAAVAGATQIWPAVWRLGGGAIHNKLRREGLAKKGDETMARKGGMDTRVDRENGTFVFGVTFEEKTPIKKEKQIQMTRVTFVRSYKESFLDGKSGRIAAENSTRARRRSAGSDCAHCRTSNVQPALIAYIKFVTIFGVYL